MAREIRLESLRGLRLPKLRELWREHVGTQKPPRLKRLIVRELAWRLQSRAHGGLDSETRRLLRAAVRQATTERAPPPRRAARRAIPRLRLSAGTKLVRTWRGRRHEVTVLEDGKRYRHRGKVYRSLTEVAEAITGAHWSGPRFFGLNSVKSVR